MRKNVVLNTPILQDQKMIPNEFVDTSLRGTNWYSEIVLTEGSNHRDKNTSRTILQDQKMIPNEFVDTGLGGMS